MLRLSLSFTRAAAGRFYGDAKTEQQRQEDAYSRGGQCDLYYRS